MTIPIKLIPLLFLLALPFISNAQQLSPKEAREKALTTLGQMTTEEKITLVSGHKWFFTSPIPRLNLPPLYMTDATQGVHIRKYLSSEYIKQPEYTTAFPSPITLAATWNPALSYQYAKAIGEECRAHGIHVLLGPGFNMYRQAQCGRNWEYFGEDPYLVSRMIERYVEGVHSTGTLATLKHFIANNTEYYRKRSNSVVSERALHEIYMPGYKAGIDAGARAVMTSYNLVNGEWAGQSKYVIDTLLRQSLGFNGLVMTDWISVWDAQKLIRSGQDLEMPMGWQMEDALALVEEGKVTEAQLDSMAYHVLETFYRFGFYGNNYQAKPEWKANYAQHIKLALETARQGLVLLKNDNQTLPLTPHAENQILVTGPWLNKNPYGSGAGFVKGFNTVYAKQALKKELTGKVQFIRRANKRSIQSADVVILTVGTREGEDWDRPFSLPKKQEEYIKKVCRLNPNTVVVVHTGSGIRMTDWANDAAAIIWGGYPGQIGQQAMAEALVGKVNPSGKLPFTIEREWAHSVDPDYLEEGSKLYKGYRLSLSQKGKDVYDVHYNEGVFTGYRWYEHQNIAPLFAFGHGLSYTTFAYSNLSTHKTTYARTDTVYVSFTLTNTGSMPGYEVAQLYVEDELSSVPRPKKELKGFAKRWLQPGESQRVVLALEPKDFMYYSTEKGHWHLEPGRFTLHVGTSSNAISLTQTISIQ